MFETRQRRVTGFLGRLRRNVAGNTLILAAVAMIPLCAMVGGALDLSRLYLTKVRLQQACDAGALAGRKDMAGGSWDQSAETAATNYFWGNFKPGAYGSGTTIPKFTSTGSNVQGQVTTPVPMTLMGMFGMKTRQLVVSCASAMQLPNTDVMFVLDNTGSMACLPSETQCTSTNIRTDSKITVLKNAVKCFYEALAQAKTDATNCPSNSYQGVNAGSQLRFGFVPYSSNVNISQLNLPASYFARNWSYQSRSKTLTDWSGWQNTGYGCNSKPADTTTERYRTQTIILYCYVQMQTRSPTWLYAKTNFAIDATSALAAFATYNVPTTPAAGTITVPGIGADFTDRKVKWNGCIEELTATSNINKIPNPSDVTSLYAPVLPDAIYLRDAPSSTAKSPDFDKLDQADSVSSSDYYNNMDDFRYFCPAPAEKLKGIDVWTPTNFANYVKTMTPVGNTYHDYGMLWGGRLLSPEGMFASENAATPTGGVIQRHLIFMTDGDAQANSCDYTNYGIAWWDKRTNTTVGGCDKNEDTNLTNDVNTRLVALCTAIKNEPNTLIWVISFGGTGITTTTKARLKGCASDDTYFFDATNSTQLSNAFQQIAGRIAQLRLQQ